MRGMLTMSPLNPEQSAHARDNITERRLFRAQPSRDLDLDAGEHGHALAHHFRRDLYLGPAAKIGPSLGGGPKRSRLRKQDHVGRPAHDLARPSHSGVDTEQPLVRGQRCQDFPYAILFFHV